ncbi:MAG: NAD-dependent epimerase [Leptospira sp.]|nr:NAD-dependent epimerase [Leptospira sp.]
MKILITGCAGFIGYHLAKLLLCDNEYIVIGIDSINDYYDPNLKISRLKDLNIPINGDISFNRLLKSNEFPHFSFSRIKLEDRDSLFSLFREHEFDIVVNLAAQAGVRYSIENPQAYIDSNIQGFVNILEACRTYPVKHLIYASSSSVYGNNKKIPFSTTDNVDNPISLYAATKKSNELMAHTYSHLFGIPTTGLRFFTVYGPWGRPDMAYFSFTKNILEGKPIQVFNHGNMKRDFTYIDDIVDGISRVMNSPPKQYNLDTNGESEKVPPYKIYNIGNNKPIELRRFIEILEDKLGLSADKINMGMQPGDVPMTYADIDDLKDDVGFEPKTNIEDGLSDFVNWYRRYYKI